MREGQRQRGSEYGAWQGTGRRRTISTRFLAPPAAPVRVDDPPTEEPARLQALCMEGGSRRRLFEFPAFEETALLARERADFIRGSRTAPDGMVIGRVGCGRWLASSPAMKGSETDMCCPLALRR